MAKPAPHLDRADIAHDRNFPEHMLLRCFNELEDACPGPGSVGGGRSRVAVPARLGPIHRKGLTVYQTIIFPSAGHGGQTKQERLTSSRVDYTADDFAAMLNGEAKIPSGLPLRLIEQGLHVLNTRAANLEEAQERFNTMARKARAIPLEDRPLVRAAPVFFHKRRGEYLQPFVYSDAPQGMNKLFLTAAQMHEMIKGKADLPEGISKNMLRGRLTVVQQQERKRHQRTAHAA